MNWNIQCCGYDDCICTMTMSVAFVLFGFVFETLSFIVTQDNIPTYFHL